MKEYRIKIFYGDGNNEIMYLTAKSSASVQYIMERKYLHLIKDSTKYEIEENKPPFMDEWLAQLETERNQSYADLIEENSYQESWLTTN